MNKCHKVNGDICRYPSFQDGYCRYHRDQKPSQTVQLELFDPSIKQIPGHYIRIGQAWIRKIRAEINS